MADLGTRLKGVWLKGMEVIGNTASNIATNTRSKVDEMNLMNRRTEILNDFGNQAYALWQKGARFPDELEKNLEELEKLDEQLNDLRAERLAGVRTEKTEDSGTTEEAAPVEKEPAESACGDTVPDTGSFPETEAPDGKEEAADNSVPVIRVEAPEKETESAAGLSEAISDLFDQTPVVRDAADKVNGALDSLEDGLKDVSEKLEKEINELGEMIAPDKKDPPQE